MNGISAVRNTCFAVLSAVEADLREILAERALTANLVEILPPDVRTNALQRFDQDDKQRPGTNPDDLDLLDYTDFADLSKMLRLQVKDVSESAGKDVTPIAEQIELLAPARNRVCHSRPLDEDDLPRFLDLSKMLLTEYVALGWKELRTVMNKMEQDPSFIFRLTIPRYWRIGSEAIAHNLPLPDFDETGFLGRKNEKNEVMKHLLGAHPVISLVGEGGVGKTALAVRCLYDLLDMRDPPAPFDVIVWVSLKTKVLTAIGVQEIRDCVTSTLGLAQAATSALGSPIASTVVDVGSLFTELLYEMKQLRILLVIDNYESLVSDSMRSFLSSVPAGSKVLITSRIGLGEIEIRYKLDPLDKKTAVILLRRYAKALNLQFLVSAADKRLERYCASLYNNPLLIKWFVSSVAAGEDPEKITPRATGGFDTALRFCFENLFNRLSGKEQQILHVLAAARRQLTQAELYFVLEESLALEQVEADCAIAALHNSSMVRRNLSDSRRVDSSIQIVLTDVAADYIARFVPPPAKLFERVQSALKKLRLVVEESAVHEAIYKYDLFAIRAGNADQRISGAFLRNALACLRTRNAEEARKNVEKARTLLPNYSEVYRISALINTKTGDLYKAAQDVETAIQLDPTAPLPRYQCATFHLYNLDDSHAALAEIDAALTLDPGDETMETFRALCLVRLGRCREAADIYEQVLINLEGRPRKWRISTRDQAAECYRRWAEQDRSLRDNTAACSHLGRAIAILDGALAHVDHDKRTPALYSNIVEDGLFIALATSDNTYVTELLDKLEGAAHLLSFPPFRKLSAAQFTKTFSDKGDVLVQVERMVKGGQIQWSSAPALMPETITAMGDANEHHGIIKSLPTGTNYGFITDDEGIDWFFHRGGLTNQDWNSLREGQRVLFRIGYNEHGKCAINVKVFET
jgi:LuxR family glucitol operon transcriptional activator